MVLQEAGRRYVLGDTVREQRPPSSDNVNGIFKEYEAYYRSFHGNCKAEESYYFGLNKIPVPPNTAIDPVKPATALSIINVAADHVDVGNPSFFVPEPSPRAKDRAERLKKFYQGAWMQVPPQVKRTAVRQSIAYGISFLKVMWMPDMWPTAPAFSADEEDYRKSMKDFMEQRKISFPIRVENANPKNLIWDDSRTGIKWVVQFEAATAGSIRRRYPEWISNKRDSDPVTYMEYWDNRWMGRMFDEQWIDMGNGAGPIEHGYGFMPFVPVVPGTSLDFDAGTPDMRFRGILRPVHNLLDAEARLVTQYEAILRQSAWRTMDFFAQGGNRTAAENVANDYELFGAKNVVYGGVEVKPSPAVVPPQEILGQINQVQTLIEMATFPNVVRGIRPTGVASGFHTSVLAGQGRLVFGPYADGMAQAMSEVNKRFAMLVENKARGKITVRARSNVESFDQTIGPDDIKGFYENMVILKAEAPEEREREAILAERLFKGGIISQYEAMRRSGVTNPLEEMNQIAAEQILMGMREQQIQAALEGVQLSRQLASAVDAPAPPNTGNQFAPGLSQLQRPGEANNQQARLASRSGEPSVFPQGLGGLELLGRQLGGSQGGGRRVPSGQRIT